MAIDVTVVQYNDGGLLSNIIIILTKASSIHPRGGGLSKYIIGGDIGTKTLHGNGRILQCSHIGSTV